MTKIAVEVHNLTVSYNNNPVLWDVDFELSEGAIVGVLGPNGSGKTTLLKSILDLVPHDSGYIRIFGEPLQSVRNRVSYVPQRESVDWDFPASVFDVVAMSRYSPKKLFKRLSSSDKAIVDNAIEQVKLGEFKNRQISQLSGGQQQRVFIARALAEQADLIIMDEPFAAIDMATEQALVDILFNLKAQGKTIIVVHHDLQTVVNYFDEVVLLNTRMVACGKTADTFTQENIAKAYGAQLTILSKVQHALQKSGFPIRENEFNDKKV